MQVLNYLHITCYKNGATSFITTGISIELSSNRRQSTFLYILMYVQNKKFHQVNLENQIFGFFTLQVLIWQNSSDILTVIANFCDFITKNNRTKHFNFSHAQLLLVFLPGQRNKAHVREQFAMIYTSFFQIPIRSNTKDYKI